jgi:hypothetical protein
VLIGDRQILLRWGKTRWYCSNPDCDQGTFTEALPAVPSRARLTARLRTRLGECIGDDLMSAVATARRYGVSGRTAARAFDAYASQQLAGLDDEQDLGEAAGIDEFRRGAPAHGTDPETGEPVQTRSQWLTHLVDLGSGGSIGLAEGRTAAAQVGLLAGHRERLKYLAMDLSATYRSGAPAGITLIADAFHLVKLANKKIDEAFRRLAYRTEHPHEELGLPRPLHYMLRYNIENLAPDCLDTIITVLDSDADGQQIAAVWIAKEHLRDLLALRATRTRVTPAPSASISGAPTTTTSPKSRPSRRPSENGSSPSSTPSSPATRTRKPKPITAPRNSSPEMPADSPTPETRPAASAWPPPAPPARPAGETPAACHGR